MTPSRRLNDRIRVLMVMPSYYPVVGGMEIIVQRLIPMLRERGIDVSVLTRRTTGTSATEIHDGTRIDRIRIPGGPGMRSIAFTALGSLHILSNRKSIDLVHSHSIMSPTTIAAATGAILRKPRVVTVHQSYEPDHLLRKPFGRQRLKLFGRVMSRFVSISSDIDRLLVEHDVPPTRIASIPNGIDTTQFAPVSEPERVSGRRKRGLPSEAPISVFVGRLQAVKNVDVLLRAWAEVNGGHLIVLGDGDERESLTTLANSLGIENRVEFRGMVSDVADYLRLADMFVLPSSSEGLSIALLEAMSSGLVPVATAIGGTSDVVQDGQSGLLVQPGDVAGLRDALQRAIDDSEWRRSASSHARERIVQYYDLNVIADRTATLYREVIRRR